MASPHHVIALFLSQLSGDTLPAIQYLPQTMTHCAKGIKTKPSQEIQ